MLIYVDFKTAKKTISKHNWYVDIFFKEKNRKTAIFWHNQCVYKDFKHHTLHTYLNITYHLWNLNWHLNWYSRPKHISEFKEFWPIKGYHNLDPIWAWYCILFTPDTFFSERKKGPDVIIDKDMLIYQHTFFLKKKLYLDITAGSWYNQCVDIDAAASLVEAIHPETVPAWKKRIKQTNKQICLQRLTDEMFSKMKRKILR